MIIFNFIFTHLFFFFINSLSNIISPLGCCGNSISFQLSISFRWKCFWNLVGHFQDTSAELDEEKEFLNKDDENKDNEENKEVVENDEKSAMQVTQQTDERRHSNTIAEKSFTSKCFTQFRQVK